MQTNDYNTDLSEVCVCVCLLTIRYLLCSPKNTYNEYTVKHVSIETMQGEGVDIYIIDA